MSQSGISDTPHTGSYRIITGSCTVYFATLSTFFFALPIITGCSKIFLLSPIFNVDEGFVFRCVHQHLLVPVYLTAAVLKLLLLLLLLFRRNFISRILPGVQK
jgi:hypothetical protein